jgi:hypothetical protein
MQKWLDSLMIDFDRNYASDETVRKINAAGSRLSSAQYVYCYEEAKEPFYAVLREANWIMDAIPGLLDIRGTLSFAVAGGSSSPYQVSHVGGDEFVLLIDQRAFYYLLTLCHRLQSLPPFAQYLENEEKEETKDYSGKYLLDITKDVVFHTNDIQNLLSGKMHRSIYQAAVTYIFGHEIAHIAHGHLEFINSITFSDFSRTEEDRNLTLQTLEMDADASATSSVFDVFEHIIGMDNFTVADARQEKAMLLRKHYVAGAFIALIYGDTLASDYLPKGHPIGYARFLTTEGVFQRLFEARCPEAIAIPDQVREAMIEAFVRISGGLSNLGHPIASNVMLYEGDSEPVAMYNGIGILAGLDHLVPLHSRWARLREHLEKYQRGGRLAPASALPA